MTSSSELFGSPEPLLFGLTPPRITTPQDRLEMTVERTLERINALPIDALALYDIDDESDRTTEERPFPYVRTIDPATYLRSHLTSWQGRTVVYRAVGKYTEPELTSWLAEADDRVLGVFVGASSSAQAVATTLTDAHQVRARVRPELPLGAVVLPERHQIKGDEHERMVAKQRAGCQFFVTQVVFNRSACRDVISDYVYYCRSEGMEPAPVLFTLSVCGSDKTLDFLGWLGVDVPRWLRNELVFSDDMLRMSVAQAKSAARELAEFCRYLNTPFGFNVESVSSRKVEIDAAGELTRYVAREVLNRDRE